MSRISKAVREEAIEALLCAADSGQTLGTGSIDDAQPGRTAWDLASAAQNSFRVLDAWSLVLDNLNAAALLRDGWCPGDPVVLLSTEARS